MNRDHWLHGAASVDEEALCSKEILDTRDPEYLCDIYMDTRSVCVFLRPASTAVSDSMDSTSVICGIPSARVQTSFCFPALVVTGVSGIFAAFTCRCYLHGADAQLATSVFGR